MRKAFITFIIALTSMLCINGDIIKSDLAAKSISYIFNNEEESLPKGVYPVEYIGQIDNRQYINTYIIPPQGCVLRCEFQFTKLIDQLNTIGIYYNGFGFGISGGMFKLNCFEYYTLTSPDLNWHIWKIDEINMIASLDDASVSLKYKHSSFNSDWDGSPGFSLFRRVRAADRSSDIPCNGARCKSLYIGTSQGALFDGIAVRFVNEQGNDEGALFDKVSRQLFRNNGSGSLKIGPDL